MKIGMLVLCWLICVFSTSAQRNIILWPTDTNSDKIVFTESIYLADVTAQTLLTNAKHFAAKRFHGESDTALVNETTRTISA